MLTTVVKATFTCGSPATSVVKVESTTKRGVFKPCRQNPTLPQQGIQGMQEAPPPVTYNAAGNTAADGTHSYEWDYADNLKKITHPGGSTEFTYDGLRRRMRILEKNAGGATLSDQRYLWCGAAICQNRSATTGGTVAKVYFPHGVAAGGTTYYYTFDHLGSVREMVNTSGAVHR